MALRILVALWISITLVIVPVSAQTTDKADAESAAVAFLRGLEGNDLGTVYDKMLAPPLQAQMTRPVFQQSFGMLRIQAGGPASVRVLVGSQALTQNPTTMQRGEFYYVRDQSTFPNGQIFQDVYLAKVDGAWKVMGYHYYAAPPAAAQTR